MRAKWAKDLLTTALISLIPTLILWLPFALKLESFWNIPLPTGGMSTIIANYDGPLYIVVAKTLYNIDQIKQLFSFPLPVEYYAAHFPLFPLLIKTFALILGYPYALITVTVVSSALAFYYFYLLAKTNMSNENALALTLFFAIFPARWLVVRSVGSPEPLFIASVLASIYYFDKKKYLQAGIWGALAQTTKSPGILLFVAYLGALLAPKLKQVATSSFANWRKMVNFSKTWPVFLIPLALLGVFATYKLTFGDFWAYFHSGDNIHLLFPPFQIFNYSAPWVGTFWLEEVLFIYLFIYLGLTKLIKSNHATYAWFVGVFAFSLIFVSHRDLLRYGLPIVPFMYIAFADRLTAKNIRGLIYVLLIPVFLFSLAFISQNVMPISDWAPFL